MAPCPTHSTDDNGYDESMVGLAQVRLSDKEAAEAKADKLQADVLELSQRLVAMKASEAERLNEVNEMCDGMVCSHSTTS